MITKERLKRESDLVQDQYLEMSFQIIKVFEYPPQPEAEEPADDWSAFVQATYGSLADDPIERGTQGSYELREALA